MLGGNEDLYYRELFEDSDVFILKSGSDFFDFTNLIVLEGVSEEDYQSYCGKVKEGPNGYDISKLEVFYSPSKQRMIVSEHVTVDDRFAPEVQMQKYVKKCCTEYEKEQEGWAGSTGPILEARDSCLRKKETNIGNMLADLVRTEFDTDIAILYAGILRADSEIAHGPFTWKMVEGLLPESESCYKVQISGKLLLDVLNQVLQSSDDSLFPLLSGLKLTFDPKKVPCLQQSDLCTENGSPIDLKGEYTVAVASSMLSGKCDEYACFRDPEVKKLNFSKNDEKDI